MDVLTCVSLRYRAEQNLLDGDGCHVVEINVTERWWNCTSVK